MVKEPSIGVFLCECGNKIAGTLDVSALGVRARILSGVTWAGATGFWCLPNGVAQMRAVIAERQLDRVIIAGCAPRTHDVLFRRALHDAVHPALVSVINLRDLCALPYRDDPTAAADQAHTQITMAVADLYARQLGAARVARITPHALVIGGGIAGMTAALALSDASIPVTLVEREPELGGGARAQADDRIAGLRARANVRVLTNTTVRDVSGTIGQYHVTLSRGDPAAANCVADEAGAIIIAIGAQSNSQLPTGDLQNVAFILCDMPPHSARADSCMRTCCVDAVRRATEIKQQSHTSAVTIFFRELRARPRAGGMYDELVWNAQQAGVRFVRYPAGRVPQAVGGTIETYDELTGRDVRVPCDQALAATPLTPRADAMQLAEMLHLPVDAHGFIAETRVRLRPTDRIERGIYVCGAAHFPCDAPRAIFQAYDVAARAVSHLQRGEIVNWALAATIDAARCNGCGDCVRACPFAAITMVGRQGNEETWKQTEWSRLAVIDSLLCTGCGNCVSVCPVKAAQVPSATDEQIEAQIRAALGIQVDRETGKQGNGVPAYLSTCLPVHLVFACEWSGYSAAEIAGARGLTYPSSARVIRVNCTGRLQPGLLLKALELGAAGVLVLGCAPGVCHYEQGNERAAAVFDQAKAIGNLMGFSQRLELKWIPPDDGAAFVHAVEAFIAGIQG
jgi:heterodisulfide reductase subunit A